MIYSALSLVPNSSTNPQSNKLVKNPKKGAHSRFGIIIISAITQRIYFGYRQLLVILSLTLFIKSSEFCIGTKYVLSSLSSLTVISTKSSQSKKKTAYGP